MAGGAANHAKRPAALLRPGDQHGPEMGLVFGLALRQTEGLILLGESMQNPGG
ncbi:MAG: hypothetical protein JWQ55_6653, partial [Rhodopila sp.]|nr:hypothetical protein [Rhodopila sp.]